MTTKTIKTIIAVIPVLLMLSVGIGIPTVDAAKCTDPEDHCYALNQLPEDADGARYLIKVTDLDPSSCPTTDEPTVTGWVKFLNGYFVENGFTSGDLAGSCYTSERYYYGYKQSGDPIEYNSASASVGTNTLFSIDDINGDKYWIPKRGSSTLASGIWMAYSSYAQLDVGLEGNINSPSSTWVPETEIRSVEKYDGGWTSPGSLSVYDDDEWRGYYHDSCFDADEDFNVGTTSGVSC